MGPCLFLPEHLFYLSHCKARWTMSVDNVGLQTCLLGTSNSMVTLTIFLGVNQTDPRTSSTSNHKFYRAWERLHGPWCKQPINYTQVVRLSFIGNRSTYVVNMGWERILPLKIYRVPQTWKYIVIFLLNIVRSISKPMKNHSM